MTHVRLTRLILVGAAAMTVGCGGTNARDINFGSDAQSGFEPPPNAVDGAATDTSADTPADTAGLTGTGGTSGAGGVQGAAGSAGVGVNDAAPDGVSDGGSN
jgi:hypothetical protein